MRVKVSVEDDARFERELPQSLRAVDAVAEHFRACGNEAQVICDRDYVDRWSYKDKRGDILVSRGGINKTVEVKGRKLHFNSMASFPYPTIIVDRASKESGLCDFYVTVSMDLTYAAIVSLSTKDDWKLSEVADRKRGYSSVPVYLCPKHLAKFGKLKRVSLVGLPQPSLVTTLPDYGTHLCQCGEYGCISNTSDLKTWYCSKFPLCS